MSITSINTEQLRRMNNSEGLVIQGCSGDLQEWVDGVNEMLTEAEILQNCSKFTNCFSFQHDGLNCILFPFEDIQLNIGKLAMWRIQTHENGLPIKVELEKDDEVVVLTAVRKKLTNAELMEICNSCGDCDECVFGGDCDDEGGGIE